MFEGSQGTARGPLSRAQALSSETKEAAVKGTNSGPVQGVVEPGRGKRVVGGGGDAETSRVSGGLDGEAVQTGGSLGKV